MTFAKDLMKEIGRNNIFIGAAALAHYLMLSIFPAMIFLLSLLPYLPTPGLYQEIMGILDQALPGDTAKMFTGTVAEIVGEKRQGLLSIGALLTIWAASNGMYATMQELNMTYGVPESRSFLRVRGTAVLLTIGFGFLVIGSFVLIMIGEWAQTWLATTFEWSAPLLGAFNFARWSIVLMALVLALAITYYFGPDVKQRFRFITPGSALGTLLIIVTSLGFKIYVENFGDYNATYGSLGAVIVLMVWLNLLGMIVLLGSEINALIEGYNPAGKDKGEKVPDGDSRPLENRIQSHEGRPMQAENFPQRETGRQPEGYGALLGEITGSVKDLVTAEMGLVRAELNQIAPNLKKHSMQAAIFGALVALSVLPFLAFLVIGLGELLDGRYWLSSLVVAVVFAVVGGLMASRSLQKIRDEDLKFPRTQDSLKRITETVKEKINDVKTTPQERRAV